MLEMCLHTSLIPPHIHVAICCRLLVVFLLSLVSSVLVAVVGHHSRPTAVLLATFFGYALSQDLFLCVRILWNIAHRKIFFKFPTSNCFDCKPVIRWKVYTLVSTLQGVVLLIISLPLVYFTFTAEESAKFVASKVAGGCVLTLSVFLWASGSSQGIYILGLFRNPLHPWTSEDIQKFKYWRRILEYFSVPGRLVLGYGELGLCIANTYMWLISPVPAFSLQSPHCSC